MSSHTSFRMGELEMREYRIRETEYTIRYHNFYGKGTPLLFIHGLGCASSFDYIEVAAMLGTSQRIILIDLLGAGYSDKPLDFEYSVKAHAQYLSEFVEDLKLDQVIVFGHSLGGAVAIELCNLISKRVKKLILSESNLDPSSDGAASFDIASLDQTNLEQEFAKKLVYYQQAGYTTWLATLRNWLPKAAFEISRNAVQGGQVSWRQLLYQFDFPKYFIFGEQTLPDPDFEKLQEQGVKIEVVPNAGHSMAWENPEGLAQAIRKCLLK